MKERRISHVGAIELSTVAAARALACAGLEAGDVDLIIYGGVCNDEQVPNSASGVQVALGATRAASIDLNTACTSFCYGLTTATAMIRTGVVRNAVVIGVELISRYMDWSNRNVAVLFGDGAAAVVLQASENEEGVLGSVLGCDAEARQTLRVRGFGCSYALQDVHLRRHHLGLRRPGDLQARRARHGRRLAPGAGTVRRDRRRRRSRGARTRPTCASSSPWPSTRVYRWRR